MSLPTGLVCKVCDNVFGAIIKPEATQLTGLVAVCAPCASKAAREKGIKLDTPESWDAALKDMI